jgi:hypothetical protein
LIIFLHSGPRTEESSSIGMVLSKKPDHKTTPARARPRKYSMDRAFFPTY